MRNKKDGPKLPRGLAVHEAGHAVARVITADLMGFDPAEALVSITFSHADLGNGARESLGVTYGPVFSKDIAARAALLMPDGDIWATPETRKAAQAAVKYARENGANIDEWIHAKALISVFGCVAEGAETGEKPETIWLEVDGDRDAFEGDCIMANAPEEMDEKMVSAAFDEAAEIYPQVAPAISALADFIQRQCKCIPGKIDTIPGKRAFATIEKALSA